MLGPSFDAALFLDHDKSGALRCSAGARRKGGGDSFPNAQA
jgi:hypothetical protein